MLNGCTEKWISGYKTHIRWKFLHGRVRILKSQIPRPAIVSRIVNPLKVSATLSGVWHSEDAVSVPVHFLQLPLALGSFLDRSSGGATDWFFTGIVGWNIAVMSLVVGVVGVMCVVAGGCSRGGGSGWANHTALWWWSWTIQSQNEQLNSRKSGLVNSLALLGISIHALNFVAARKDRFSWKTWKQIMESTLWHPSSTECNMSLLTDLAGLEIILPSSLTAKVGQGNE